MATYSSFSSIGVSTPFLMKHRGLKIALRGYQCTQPTNRHVRHDDHREHYREPRRPRGLLSSIFGAFSFTSKERNPKTVNTRPNHPLSRYPDLRTGVSRLVLVPTRRSTSGLGTSGAAAPRNGATKRGSQARAARKAPPVAWTSSYTSIRGTYLMFLACQTGSRSSVSTAVGCLRTVYGMTGGRRDVLVGDTSVLGGFGNTR